jgi:DNA sulfur modification protein DndB
MPIGEIEGIVKKKIGTQVYYFGTVMSDKIKNITFVPVIQESKKTYLAENPENGYQRPGSKSRMRQFMRYLKEHPNSVVPPVLISGRDEWRFKSVSENEEYGKLIIEAPAAIIDGQHRIGGYIALFEDEEEDRPIDFILLEGFDTESEIKEFTTVNNTQKGVPKALTAFLEDRESARIAWALNEEEDSPFKDRITRINMERSHLFALHSVAKQIERTFNRGGISDFDEDEKIEALIKYWTIISDEFDDEWSDIEKLDDTNTRGRKDFEYKLLELTGFIVWSLIGSEILGRSYLDGVGINWEHVSSLVRSCGEIDWRKDGQYAGRTGEAGASFIKLDLERLITDTGVLTDDEEPPF